MNSRRPSRYKLITFAVAAVTGIVVGELLFPDTKSVANILVTGAVAAAVAVLMAWLGSRRAGD